MNDNLAELKPMRRPLVVGGAWIVSIFAMACPGLLRAADAVPAQVRWLDKDAPALAQGLSWGVPWAKGTVSKDQTFTLKSADGKVLPVQSWPLAYWQDGSIKWTGFATVAGPD